MMLDQLGTLSGGKERSGDAVDGTVPDEGTARGVQMVFEEFVRARLAALVRFGRALTGDRTAGEDLAQAALVKVYPKWARITGDQEAYVRRAMVNTHVSWWRRRWRESTTERTPENPAPDPSGDVELEQVMWKALADVPARRRAALVLRFYEDLPIARIAEVLGCRAGTAKSHISRGLSELRKSAELAGYDVGNGDLNGADLNGAEPGTERR